MNIGVPSLEFMQFQSDALFKEMTAAIGVIRVQGNPTTKVVFESGLENIINKRLKTQIELRVRDTPALQAYAALPDLNKTHPFMAIFGVPETDAQLGRFVANLPQMLKRVGTVNMDEGIVSGVFSEIPVTVAISSGFFNSRATDSEIAAVLLHEIGHVVTYFYYILHGTIGGFISTAIATAAVGAKGDAERRIIFEQGARVMGIDGVGVATMLQQTPAQNAELLQTLYVNETTNQLRSQTGYGVYELKCCEQLADAFAARFGAGLALASGLHYLENIHSQSRGRVTYVASMACATVQKIISPLTSGKIPETNPLLLLLTGQEINPYDTFPNRIKLIKQHLIEGLKVKGLDPEDRKKFIKDAEEIDKILKTVEYQPTFFDRIRSVVFPRSKRKIAVQDLQKTIEDMMYNETFIHAAKLQGATK